MHVTNSSKNIIGQPERANTIAYNRGSGVLIDGSGGNGNQVWGNRIGVVGTGTGAGNAAGVSIQGPAGQNSIQYNTIDYNTGNGVNVAISPGNSIQSNTIAHNVVDGVSVVSSLGNTILSNVIFANGGKGIHGTGFPWLPDGGTVITASASTGTITGVTSLSAGATLQIFQNTAAGTAPTLLATGTAAGSNVGVLTWTAGGSFTLSLPLGTLTAGDFVTMTFTDANGTTSQFSSSFQVTA